MPYISQQRRDDLHAGAGAEHPGELNYQITDLVVLYWENHAKCYSSINDILGALEGAKLEFYRRVVVPYEDKKILENGDVYGTGD